MGTDPETDLFADGAAYEQYVGRWSRPVGSMFIDWLARPPGLNWVDVGCGTGALTETVLTRANPASVVGVEPSEAFLGLAQARIDDVRADFRTGDAQSLPVASGAADIAVSGLVLNFVPDQQRMVEEMRRVVGANGTIAAYVWDYSGEMQLMRHFWDAAIALFPNAAAHDEGRLFPICEREPLAKLFRASGLSAVETCALDTPTVFRDFEDYWSPFLRGQGPAGAYCVALADDDQERLRARLERTLPMNADGSISLIARAWAVRGIA